MQLNRPHLLAPLCWASLLFAFQVNGSTNLTVSPVTFGRIGGVNFTGVKHFDSDSIANARSDQWRWCSVFESRLVLNPGPDCAHSAHPLSNDLPLQAAYWTGERPVLLNLMKIGLALPELKPNSVPSWSYQLPRNGRFFEPGRWSVWQARVATENGLAKISSTGEYGCAGLLLKGFLGPDKVRVTLDVARTDGAWSLKVNNQGGGVDVLELQKDTSATGVFTSEIDAAALPQKGKTLELRAYAIGQGRSVWIRSLSLEAAPAPRLTADTVSTTWYPSRLHFEARFDKAGLKLRGTDFFLDQNTLARILEADAPSSPTELALNGRWPSGTAVWQADAQSVVVAGSSPAIAVRLVELEGDQLTLRPLQWKPSLSGAGWDWSQSLRPERGLKLAAIYSFATKAEGAETALRRAGAIAPGTSFAAALTKRKEAWDQWLARVPVPDKWGIQGVPAMGLTPEDHRRWYYAAWTFIGMNVLPAMPEANYAYLQTPCGKPSLWNEGSSKAKASCAWESFFGQQFLAYLNPEAAWSAFEGIMSEVDQTGWLSGECLPSRKAQTAWILYSLSGDHARLAKVYPAIKRYLVWREKNPRWIYGSYNDPNSRDAEFVISHCVDVDYARRIAGVLLLEADREFWRQMIQRVLANYRQWHFTPETGEPKQYFDVKSGKRTPGQSLFTLTGLHLRDLDADLMGNLKRQFAAGYRADRRIAGLPSSKYPDASFIAYGLLENAPHPQAEEFINILLRDVMLCSDFSESISTNGKIGGTRPTLFNVGQVIDFTWLMNGVRMDQGRPTAISSAGANR